MRQVPNNAEGDLSRRRFVTEQCRVSEHHFRQTASAYDKRYGQIEETHLECVREFLSAMEPGQELLDAACGTGKYFGIFTASGRSVFGIDQSAEMLAQAGAKWPDVPTQRMALQDLRNALNWRGRFGGLVCIDAMEWVLRDDWLGVLDGFRAVLRPASLVYLTIELPGGHEEETLDPDAPECVMPGEIFVQGWYNHLPDRQTVLGWLSSAGFRVSAERIGDYYWHLLMQSL